MATTTRGGTKEIGSALTRLCLRNRSVEAKLKSLTSSLFDSFISPLQDRVDEWKKIISQIDKEHSKEIKRLKQFRKKHVTSTFANNTFRMRKHLPRGKLKNDFPRIASMYDVDKIIIESSMDCNNKEKYFMLEEVERNYVRRALIEERLHYCLFFNFLRPVIEEEISMLQEIIHLEEILTTLTSLTNDPHKLPTSSENFIHSLQFNDSIVPILDSNYSDYGSHHNHHHHSRKSSISSMNSLNTLSTDSVSFRNVKSLSQVSYFNFKLLMIINQSVYN
ncbi:metastasis suppressor protein 1-like protein [Euroglyphus maynei]|uniref:Metastasis suppressor protein 1-like protein n=1 Tax=Euroglyphus maynei TaxID=6958 RepID=A0A1Y3BIX5_EURMA|nr:metastasis suppressor protein 1-like protein [Euroglyphus maynei]